MMFSLIKRNLKIYFRDKSTVFFSLLAVIILLALYLVFLMETITPTEGVIPGIESVVFARTWIMAGVISVTTVNTTLGAYGVFVSDKETNVMYDFKVSPIKRSKLVLSYIVSSLIVGLIMSILAFIIAEIYIVISGGDLLSLSAILKSLIIIVLGVTMSSSVIFFIVNFVKSVNAMGAVNAVFSSIVGFLMGVYVPVGLLGNSVEWIIKGFPFSHTAAMMRQVLIEDVLPSGVSLTDIDTEYFSFTHYFGILYYSNGEAFPFYGHVLVCIGVSIVFFTLGLMVYSRKRK